MSFVWTIACIYFKLCSVIFLTGVNIYKVIDEAFQRNDFPWSNCLAVGCDNANAMTGEKNGVYGCIMKEHPDVYLSGCLNHLIYIAAKTGETSKVYIIPF